MKIKTSELINGPLNWAVAQVRQLPLDDLGLSKSVVFRRGQPWMPDSYWEQGGPIIEEERIELEHDGFQWWARITADEDFSGPTPLVAAMRCYVASHSGDEVDVPDQLLGV